jgi:glycosyltransferase involved in cell wall biosynthesis
VSALVMAGNEEEGIRDCLESVAWADEIVVVDSCSTDRTAEIAREYTDRVIIKPWQGYVRQKQWALSKARYPWILFVDADERVTPGLRGEILEELARDPIPYAGYLLPRRVCYMGRWIRHGDWYPDYKLRLFLAEHGRVTGEEPHDRVEVSGPLKRLKRDLLHYTYRDLGDHLATVNRFSTISARGMYHRGQRCGLGAILFRPVIRFLRSYVLRRGFLDGIPGLIAALVVAFGVFAKYVKLFELRLGRGGAGGPPPCEADKP